MKSEVQHLRYEFNKELISKEDRIWFCEPGLIISPEHLPRQEKEHKIIVSCHSRELSAAAVRLSQLFNNKQEYITKYNLNKIFTNIIIDYQTRHGDDDGVLNALFDAAESIAAGIDTQLRSKKGICKYPAIDRSDMKFNFVKQNGLDYLDIGWAEGLLTGGRPFRIELWVEDGIMSIVVFISVQGIENITEDELVHLLEQHGIVLFTDKRYASIGVFSDGTGNDFYSINIVLSDEETDYADTFYPMKKYDK